jgi:hypothetical protein
LQYDAKAAAAFNDKEGLHDEADCNRSIGIRTSSGVRMLPVQRELDCSATVSPPMSYVLGSHAEATHLELRATLANHLHEQHLQHQQRASSHRSA